MNDFGLELRRIGALPGFDLTPHVFDIRGWGAGTIPVGGLSARVPVRATLYQLAFAIGASARLSFEVPSHH
jgi:hypothetical protein